LDHEPVNFYSYSLSR